MKLVLTKERLPSCNQVVTLEVCQKYCKCLLLQRHTMQKKLSFLPAICSYWTARRWPEWYPCKNICVRFHLHFEANRRLVWRFPINKETIATGFSSLSKLRSPLWIFKWNYWNWRTVAPIKNKSNWRLQIEIKFRRLHTSIFVRYAKQHFPKWNTVDSR